MYLHVLKPIHLFLDDEEVTNWLMDTVLEAHQIVKRMANMQEDTKGMGTTVAIAVVDGDDAFFCHVGDSRIYIYDDQEITQDKGSYFSQ